MTLQIHRAERADRLVDTLADLLSEPLEDPFATEVVCVPTQGVERWLAQRLSQRLGTSPGGRDGICVGVTFPSLATLMTWATTTSAQSPDQLQSSGSWAPDHAVWPLLAVIDDCRSEPWADLLWSYLAGHPGADTHSSAHSPAGPDRTDAGVALTTGRRWRTARQLAELFSRYATSRPTMIEHWAAGRDLDGRGRPLPADLAWQAGLWRRLRERLDAPSPLQEVTTAVARLEHTPEAVELPARLSVFGATRLDHDHLQLLAALAHHRDVHLWLPHPSPALWTAVVKELTDPLPLGPRTSDRTANLVGHPLLSYLGRDLRELQVALHAQTEIAVDRHHPAPVGSPDTVLGRLQADLTANRDPEETEDRPMLDRTDDSVAVHASYGPDRQVEVLREVLVGLLADDETLEPRDIVVMCPDIERFAPLISAAFGLDSDADRAEHPGHALRVRLADRSLRQLNPLVSVLSRMLELAESRVTASSVLDLAAFPPVARKFGFTEEDTARLQSLVTSAGVRWGLDASHRQPYGMESFGQGTWAAGLDRLILGVAMDEDGDHFIGTALPLDDIDSSDVDLVGRLVELVSRIGVFVDAAGTLRTLPEWAQLGRSVIEGLTATGPTDGWQVAQAYAELARLTDAAGVAEETLLSRAELQALLSDAFRGRPSRANFRTGTLTMCTMHPMRSIPHRVVCLLGVDDGVFPRRMRPVGDDILAAEEWIGDRDARSEDRQLLLDAIMAAQEHLVIIYGGADPRTGSERPPAVPIGELLDALDATVVSPDDQRVRDHLVRHHPLQPFDPGNFAAERGRPFSFDRAAVRGARAAARVRQPAPGPFGSGPISPAPLDEVIALTDLVRFFSHPARALLRLRARLVVEGDDRDSSSDQLPVELDGLERWAIGERLLERHLRGADLNRIAAAEWRRGSLPPRAFGQAALDQVLTTVREVAEQARGYLTGEPGSLDARVDIGGGLVAGTVQPLYGLALVRVGYGGLSVRQRLASWLHLLTLSAAHPDRQWSAVTVGRGGRSVLGPVDPDWAGRVLADLVDLYRTGLREPLPFAPRTSAEYALVRLRDRSLALYETKIATVWDQERDTVWERFLGPAAGLSVLMEQPSRASEERGTLVEPSRFGTLARRVFSPLLRAEELT